MSVVVRVACLSSHRVWLWVGGTHLFYLLAQLVPVAGAELRRHPQCKSMVEWAGWEPAKFRSGSDFGFDSIKWLSATSQPRFFLWFAIHGAVPPPPCHHTAAADLDHPSWHPARPRTAGCGEGRVTPQDQPDPMATSVSSAGHCRPGSPGPGTLARAGSEIGAAVGNGYQGRICLLLPKQTKKWFWLSSLKSPQLALCAEPGLKDPCRFSRKKIWLGKNNEIGFRQT